MFTTIIYPNEELEVFNFSQDIFLRHKKSSFHDFVSNIFPNFSKERFQDPCFQKFASYNDDLFLYCEFIEMVTDPYEHILSDGVKYIYCYDFQTKACYFEHDQNCTNYIRSLIPMRNEEKISYKAKEYFPAGSWERIYLLN